jgi:hypothetical protein
MLTTSLRQCHGCRLTWFPQSGAGAACPACGGTKIGGTPELFHAGIALILAGAIAWFMRHGPLSEAGVAPAPVAARSAQPIAGDERKPPVSSVKVDPAKVKPVAVKRTVVKPGKVKKVKANAIKRRPKKAKTRSKYVQR